MEINNSSNWFSVAVAMVSALGGVAMTYLTVVYRRRIVKQREPKDRIELIFDGYDALIAQMREQIANLQKLTEAQASEIGQLEEANRNARKQIDDSAVQISRLEAQLNNLRTMQPNGTNGTSESPASQ